MKAWALILWGLVFMLACQQKDQTPPLTIACAASAQYAMAELIELFEESEGVSCQMITGSSGKLTAQIINGAPYDVFVSADTLYPHKLQAAGLSVGPMQVYGYGTLVLWTTVQGITPSLASLRTLNVHKIALPNPRLAPYGQSADRLLREHQLSDDTSDKLIFGESVAQTNQFIVSGSVDIGFTSLSTVLAPALQDSGSWIPLTRGTVLPQAAVAMQSSDRPQAASRFVAFLSSDTARSILDRHGLWPIVQD